MADWSSAQYLKFEAERTQPARDLAARIPLQSVGRVLDVGCGPANSTLVVQKRYPKAQFVGIDSSPDMLAAAKKAMPEAEFLQADAGGDLGHLGRFDVVYSNACLQWIPDHAHLLPNLMATLTSGGALAAQIPLGHHPGLHIQNILDEVATLTPYVQHINMPRVYHILADDEYYDILRPISSDVQIWQTTYTHVLEGPEAILEWYRATGLRPYLAALPEDLRPAFEADVLAGIKKCYPPQEDGRVLFRFPRLFFIATRA